MYLQELFRKDRIDDSFIRQLVLAFHDSYSEFGERVDATKAEVESWIERESTPSASQKAQIKSLFRKGLEYREKVREVIEASEHGTVRSDERWDLDIVWRNESTQVTVVPEKEEVQVYIGIAEFAEIGKDGLHTVQTMKVSPDELGSDYFRARLARKIDASLP